MINLYPIKIDDEILCYATTEKNARLISYAIYPVRGFFSGTKLMSEIVLCDAELAEIIKESKDGRSCDVSNQS